MGAVTTSAWFWLKLNCRFSQAYRVSSAFSVIGQLWCSGWRCVYPRLKLCVGSVQTSHGGGASFKTSWNSHVLQFTTIRQKLCDTRALPYISKNSLLDEPNPLLLPGQFTDRARLPRAPRRLRRSVEMAMNARSAASALRAFRVRFGPPVRIHRPDH